MKVGSMHFLCCCNCGGHHKASKCMERKDAQTADDPADGDAESVSQSGARQAEVHTSRGT